MANNKILIGTVVSIDDPTCSGRIKVQVKGYNDNIPVEQLPWCSHGGSAINSANGGGSISIARVGQQVRIKFNKDAEDPESMEWYAVDQLDPKLINEIASDYAGTHVLLYDSAKDISFKYQPGSGVVLYYAGSFIQITPDNNITIHYGKGATGTQIQLSDGRVDIQASNEINLTTKGTINLEADNIVLNAKTSTQIKGDKPGECAVNGVKLMTALIMLANAIDNKVPQTAGIQASYMNALKEGILCEGIQYI